MGFLWIPYICKADVSKQMLDKQAYKILIENSSLRGIKSNFTLLPSSGLNIYFEVICPLDGSSMAMHLIWIKFINKLALKTKLKIFIQVQSLYCKIWKTFTEKFWKFDTNSGKF